MIIQDHMKRAIVARLPKAIRAATLDSTWREMAARVEHNYNPITGRLDIPKCCFDKSLPPLCSSEVYDICWSSMPSAAFGSGFFESVISKGGESRFHRSVAKVNRQVLLLYDRS